MSVLFSDIIEIRGRLTLCYGEINEDTALRLCTLCEDRDKHPRRQHTEKRVAIEEGVVSSKERTGSAERKGCCNVSRRSTRSEVRVGTSSSSRELFGCPVGELNI